MTKQQAKFDINSFVRVKPYHEIKQEIIDNKRKSFPAALEVFCGLDFIVAERFINKGTVYYYLAELEDDLNGDPKVYYARTRDNFDKSPFSAMEHYNVAFEESLLVEVDLTDTPITKIERILKELEEMED